jgi:hypothetical protein
MKTTRKPLISKLRTLAPLTLLILSGCLTGPEWNRDLDFEGRGAALGSKKLVISDLYLSFEGDVPRGERLRKRAGEFDDVDDISKEIAGQLARAGIKAIHRDHCDPLSLAEGEALVRGEVIRTAARGTKSETIFCIGLLGTLTLMGGWFPSPLPSYDGATFSCYIEILDSRGEVLVHAREQEIISDYCTYGYSAWSDDLSDYRISRDLTLNLARSLEELVRSGARNAAGSVEKPNRTPEGSVVSLLNRRNES